MPEFISATAEIGGEYRYTLTRVWAPRLNADPARVTRARALLQ
jgi:hypothetical protein